MGLFKSSFVKVPKHQQFQYAPRYSDAAEEERKAEKLEEKRIKFERGKIFKTGGSQISGTLKSNYIINKSKASKAKRYKMMLYLTLMIGTIYGLFTMILPFLFGLLLILILLVLFIRENNRH